MWSKVLMIVGAIVLFAIAVGSGIIAWDKADNDPANTIIFSAALLIFVTTTPSSLIMLFLGIKKEIKKKKRKSKHKAARW